jgi:decaprenyl-phosphate phosphoribosyltransferase
MTTTSTRSGTRLPALLRAARPKQWVKNVLVVAAPVTAGTIFEPEVLRGTLVAFVAFTLAAIGVYLVNDVRDVEEDRAHPTKRLRPIAAGELSPRVAVAVALVAFAAGTGVATFATTALVVVVLSYIVLSLAYSMALKDQAVIDLAIVAAGFVLRATAGGVASGIVLSQWFLLAAAFGSLFMVAGKRYSELRELGDKAATSRRSLGSYSLGYLRFVWTLSATILIATYCLWAFEVQAEWHRPVFAQVSIAPFVLGILRYSADIDHGTAGAPEDIVLRDRALQALGVLWAATFLAGVFGV